MTNIRFDEFADERVQTNGITLRCRFAGAGPAVVLLHGWCGFSHRWRKVAPRLADYFTVIVPDMRGYGDSDKPDTGYDALTAAADIGGLHDHFKSDLAHVVGHVMGAPVGLVFSGLFPKRSLSVTYLDEPIAGYNLEHYTAFLRANHGGIWQFGLNWTPGLAEILYAGLEVEFLKHIFSEMTMVKDAITEADVGLALGGEASSGPVLQQIWGAVLSDFRGQVIPKAGHWLGDENPAAVADALLAFFRETEANVEVASR